MSEVLAIRHTAQADGIPDVTHASVEAVIGYTREQDARSTVFPKIPSKWWLVFMDDGSYEGTYRSRFYGAFENRGEAIDEATDTNRFFNITLSTELEAMRNRLVVGWTTPRRWHRQGVLAAAFEVVEIADPAVIPFPSFDDVLLTYRQLQRVVDDPHYSRWHSALRAVKGIYLITDTSNGKNYVGKADGADGFFGRWTAYAHNGHGWNRELVKLPKGQCEYFVFSILRVFEPRALQQQVDDAEGHYKRAIGSREFGYNAN